MPPHKTLSSNLAKLYDNIQCETNNIQGDEGGSVKEENFMQTNSCSEEEEEKSEMNFLHASWYQQTRVKEKSQRKRLWNTI